jgi:hypothetical protein
VGVRGAFDFMLMSDTFTLTKVAPVDPATVFEALATQIQRRDDRCHRVAALRGRSTRIRKGLANIAWPSARFIKVRLLRL